jgi:hypothetical protein
MFRRQVLTGPRYHRMWDVAAVRDTQSPKIAQAAINAANCEDLQANHLPAQHPVVWSNTAASLLPVLYVSDKYP